MPTIYLIRHGEIAQSTPRRFVGQRDLPLTELGREQIARVAEFLATRSIDRILTSPLTRCRQSAHILTNRLQLAKAGAVAGLQEIGLGAWEGRTVEQLRSDFPGEYEARGLDIAGFRPTGGESFTDLLHRAWSAFDTFAAGADEPVAVVAHAGVNRVLLCRILGMPLANLFRLDQDYGCVNIMHREKDEYRLESLNLHP
jgi:alpha-ribazole phosphatase